MVIERIETMSNNRILNQSGRKIVVTGHYGSGKTEFAVSLAMLLATAQEKCPPVFLTKTQENRPPVSLIDLDIVNPYFRSREQRDVLESAGVTVHGSIFDKEITAELPALGASLRAPLEDSSCRVIVDAGGNDTGALVLNQFSKYFKDDTTVLAIVNANRPDTSDIDGTLLHITAIESITGLTVSGIVNNTHLLRETTTADIIKGHTLCKKVSDISGKPLLCNCYAEGLVDPHNLTGLSGYLMPLGLYMRPTWLDK